MQNVLVPLDGGDITIGPLAPQHGHVLIRQTDVQDPCNVDDRAMPPAGNGALALPSHDHRRLFAKGGGHGTDAAKPVKDRRRRAGYLTVHNPHVMHKESVRQSHFERVCENGTVAGVNHREILQALIALDLKQDEIAAVIGRDRSAVSRLLKGERAIKVGEVEGLTALIERTRAAQQERPAEVARDNEVHSAPPPPAFTTLAKDVPVRGTALGGDLAIDSITQAMQVEQTVLEPADTIEFVRRPPAFTNNRDLYAVYVAGSSMEPRHGPGDLLYVDPKRPASIGDDVIVQLRDGNGHDGEEQVVCALIKRLVRRTTTSIELEQYNPPLRFTLASHHYAAVHRVVRATEFFTI